ncbi:hypothetical protein [Flexivirga meconopsidis]|uniref:hypothetical protein n=1 Tax=Flexivirga meconopsidis TaxID=2977121 RepID=UPI00223F9402|nr:hypothetical protein [Flexivirga meconopsidis]
MRINKGKRLAAAGVVVAALSGGAVAAGSSQADAAPPAARCGTVNPVSATRTSTVRSTYVTTGGHRIRIELRQGYIGGRQYGWARITNASGGRLTPGDRVWLDVTNNGARTWTGPCGTRVARGEESVLYTAAVRTSSSSQYQLSAVGGIPRYRQSGRFVVQRDLLAGRTSWW